MRNIFDSFSKELLERALAPSGIIETEAEVHHALQRADLRYRPDPARAKLRASLGLLARLTDEPCLLEPFHKALSKRAAIDCLYKLLAFWRYQKRRFPDEPALRMWILCAGRPSAAIEALGFQQAKDFPPGVYLAPPGLRLGLVVIRELPETRDTLLLRLMGSGLVLMRAFQELRKLPADAPEAALALPILLGYRGAIPNDPAKRTHDDREFLMVTQGVVDLWKQKLIAQGERKGQRRGERKGIEKGRLVEARAALRRVLTYRKLALSPAEDARIEHCEDLATLERWHDQAIEAKSAAAALR